MILFFSGNTTGAKNDETAPELALAEKECGVMLSYHFIITKDRPTIKRFKRHLKRRRNHAQKQR